MQVNEQHLCPVCDAPTPCPNCSETVDLFKRVASTLKNISSGEDVLLEECACTS